MGNPAYPEDTDRGKRPREAVAGPCSGLRGQLPLLPFTADESQRIRELLRPRTGHGAGGSRGHGNRRSSRPCRASRVHPPGGARLRRRALRQPVRRPGPDAAPAGQETADDDGFLSLHEIYPLPLQDCELAVLSACETNVGPQRPLEAGVTLASGFLAAGARRVVASHWSVDDQSTAELMSTFFAEATTPQQGVKVNYAKALQKAALESPK